MPNAISEMPLSRVVTQLIGVIGKKLTAYVAGLLDTRAIDRWIASDTPDRGVEERLRLANEIVTIFRIHENSEVVQAWLVGINPDLGDRIAIRLLRDGRVDVGGPVLLGAARHSPPMVDSGGKCRLGIGIST
jgi:hypothetical protein